MWVQQICFAQMAQEVTNLDHLHEVEHMGERVARLEQTIVDGDRANFAPDIGSGQGPTGIAQILAVTIAAELGNILYRDRSRNRRFGGVITFQLSVRASPVPNCEGPGPPAGEPRRVACGARLVWGDAGWS